MKDRSYSDFHSVQPRRHGKSFLMEQEHEVEKLILKICVYLNKPFDDVKDDLKRLCQQVTQEDSTLLVPVLQLLLSDVQLTGQLPESLLRVNDGTGQKVLVYNGGLSRPNLFDAKSMFKSALIKAVKNDESFNEHARKTKLLGNEPTAKPIVTQTARIGRNSPCPCGSGTKYKHCCLGK